MSETKAREIHLVGSVPLSSAEEVFRAAAAILGDRLTKIPDGETGRRKNWVGFQYPLIAENPAFEFDGPPVDPEAVVNESDGEGADYEWTKLKIREGVDPQTIEFKTLGYSENALASYRIFAELKRSGVIPQDTCFQVSLPTPLAPVALYFSAEHLFAVYPAYSRALVRELGEIVAGIRHGELAIQWDVAVEFGLWEGLFPPPPGDWQGMLLGQFHLLGNAVPANVQLGYHLCYGDRGHQHFIEPLDTTKLVEVANGIAAGLERRLDWIHLPVPRSRDDGAYFAPLRALCLPVETKLFLGLIHHTDGVAGARKRIATAQEFVPHFGLGTECGLGRRRPATILELLKLHAAIR